MNEEKYPTGKNILFNKIPLDWNEKTKKFLKDEQIAILNAVINFKNPQTIPTEIEYSKFMKGFLRTICFKVSAKDEESKEQDSSKEESKENPSQPYNSNTNLLSNSNIDNLITLLKSHPQKYKLSISIPMISNIHYLLLNLPKGTEVHITPNKSLAFFTIVHGSIFYRINGKFYKISTELLEIFHTDSIDFSRDFMYILVGEGKDTMVKSMKGFYFREAKEEDMDEFL